MMGEVAHSTDTKALLWLLSLAQKEQARHEMNEEARPQNLGRIVANERNTRNCAAGC